MAKWPVRTCCWDPAETLPRLVVVTWSNFQDKPDTDVAETWKQKHKFLDIWRSTILDWTPWTDVAIANKRTKNLEIFQSFLVLDFNSVRTLKFSDTIISLTLTFFQLSNFFRVFLFLGLCFFFSTKIIANYSDGSKIIVNCSDSPLDFGENLLATNYTQL